MPPLIFPAVVISSHSFDIYEAVSVKKKLLEVIKSLEVIKQA